MKKYTIYWYWCNNPTLSIFCLRQLLVLLSAIIFIAPNFTVSAQAQTGSTRSIEKLLSSPDVPPLESKISIAEIETIQTLSGPKNKPMIMPTDVAIGNNDQIYIVDSGNNRIVVYSHKGKYLFSFGEPGEKDGQLLAPVGIATAGDGSVLVADRGNRRVQVFDGDGTFLRSIPTLIGDKPVTPVDVALDDVVGRLYVTISSPLHQVLVYGSDGKVETRWGKPGNNLGEFRYPATVALGPDGNIYVVDVFNSRVQVFDKSGKVVVTVGSWGVSPGQLFRPKGVAVGGDGTTYISDSYLGVVQVFESDTRFRSVLGVDGKINHFDTPTGIAVGRDGRVYVAEMLKNQVSVLKLLR